MPRCSSVCPDPMTVKARLMSRMSRRSLRASLARGTTATALSGCARGTANPSPSVLRLGHAYGVGSIQTRAAERFAAEVSARSNQQITVDLYPSGQLGSWEDMQESTEIG